MTMFTANIERRGEIAILLGASLWGLFWIPVHYLNNIGIDGLWAVVYLFAAAVPISLATLYWGEGFNRNNFKITALIGLLIGLAATLYFSALVYIDVVRVIFLFYLLPIWATILSRIINKEPIGKRRSLAIVVALAGLWLLLSQGRNWPLPQSIGDGMAIASGFFWALCLVVLKARPKVSALSSTAYRLTHKRCTNGLLPISARRYLIVFAGSPGGGRHVDEYGDYDQHAAENRNRRQGCS